MIFESVIDLKPTERSYKVLTALETTLPQYLRRVVMVCKVNLWKYNIIFECIFHNTCKIFHNFNFTFLIYFVDSFSKMYKICIAVSNLTVNRIRGEILYIHLNLNRFWAIIVVGLAFDKCKRSVEKSYFEKKTSFCQSVFLQAWDRQTPWEGVDPLWTGRQL